VLFLHVTTKLPDAPRDDLLRELGGSGYPMLVFLDGDGTVLGEQLGERSVRRFNRALNGVRRVVALAKKEELTRAERLERFFLECELGRLDWVDAEAAAKKLPKLEASERKQVVGALANLEYHYILDPPPKSTDEIVIAGEKFAEMVREGRIPADKTLYEVFWGFQIFYARDVEDPKVYERALAETTKLWAGDAKKEKRLAQLRRELANLKVRAAGEKEE
jgi:hypothetical protein